MIAVIDGTKDTLTAAGNKRRVLLAFVVLVKRLRARQLALCVCELRAKQAFPVGFFPFIATPVLVRESPCAYTTRALKQLVRGDAA